jgi:hypothetical protein
MTAAPDNLGNLDTVQLRFKYTEAEYVAAARLFLWRSRELVIRLVLTFAFISVGVILLLSLTDLPLPLWATISVGLLVGIALCHGLFLDLPRRYFRGDPKFRDEYDLTFSDQGIKFRTTNIDAFVDWGLYTGVIQNKNFYLLVYGKDIASISIIPRRAFQDPRHEMAFREMLGRHIEGSLGPIRAPAK